MRCPQCDDPDPLRLARPDPEGGLNLWKCFECFHMWTACPMCDSKHVFDVIDLFKGEEPPSIRCVNCNYTVRKSC